MDVTAQALETTLATLTPHVRPASDANAVAGVRPRVVVEPETEEQVAAILRYANTERLAVIPCGGATQQALGTPPTRADIILSLARLNQIIEHAPHDLTLTAQAGVRLVDLQQALGAAHQWLALDPPLNAGATLGGLISTNVSGARRLRYGGVRDQIIGVRVALADGTIARGGGKVVKNVAGYDLPKLFTGALGTLGVILSANFRLYPLPDHSATALLASDDLSTLGAVALRILAAPLTPTALDISSPTASGEPYLLAARIQSGVRASVDEQVSAICGATIATGATIQPTLTGDDEARFWDDRQAPFTARPADGDAITTTIKASLLPTDVVGWLTELEALRTNGSLAAPWQAHAGHGLIFARLTGTPQAVISAIGDLRHAAIQRHGSLVITDLPAALVDAIDPWGPIPALSIMRNLKARFDPNGILNPGRFVGGL
ncbi:MAG TPA: FAD-binding oxidoreductase [Ktedonobacterales bacterium]